MSFKCRHDGLTDNRGIHGNIFKLRISGFQALATSAAYKSCPRSRILENFNGSQEENFSGYAARKPFALRKPAFGMDFIDYTKNTIFTSTYVTIYGSSYIFFLDILKYHPRYYYFNASIITMPQYRIKHYKRKCLYGLFIGSAINSDSIL